MSSPPAHRQRRETAKQRVVVKALGASDKFRSAQQLYVQIHSQRATRIGLTSIYRILHSLAQDGIAECQRAEDGEALYRLRTEPGHRHYLVCRRCGRAVGFTPATLEQDTIQLSRRSDFTDVTHHVDLYGICPQCRKPSVA